MNQKMIRRFLVLVLTLCLLPVFCFDAGATNNNSKGSAKRIYSGNTVSESIGGKVYNNGIYTVDDGDDWFYFILSSESTVTISLTSDYNDVRFQLFNSSTVLNNPCTSYSETLSAGTYYIDVSSWNGVNDYYTLSFNVSTVCTHSDYSYNVIGATCYVEGYTQYTCNDCGYSWDGNYVGYVHPYGNWSTVSNPTCTENGLRERYCTKCGYRDTQTIPATGHTCTDWVVSREPSCVNEGIESAICVTCGHEDTRTFPALGHSYGEWTTTREATCTVQGVKTQTCTRCKHKVHEDTPPTDHIFGDWFVLEESTCNKKGADIRFCSECGTSETQEKNCKHNMTIRELTKVSSTRFEDTNAYLVQYTYNCSDCDYKTYSEYLVSDYLRVEKGTTRIADNACKNCDWLDGVFIPDSVTYIGYGAFMNCRWMDYVNIGSGVKYIGSYAFANTNIQEITIPDGVTKIQDYTFSSCFYLRNVNLPNGITSIGDYAFNGCYNLSSIELPLKLETIGDSAFFGTEISRIVLPQSVQTLGDYVFDPYCIQRITISGARPNHVGSRSAFGSCSANVYYNFQNDDDAGSYSHYGLGQYLNWIDCNHTEKNPRTCASPTVCKTCGALGATYYMPKHTYSGGTCEEPGVCTECGKVDTESLGHVFGEYVISDATCTKNETKTATCEKCGETDTIEIPGTALGHDFANYSSNNDAKCNLDGTKSAKCTRCSVKNTVSDTGSAKDHTDVLLDSKPVTCTENGLTSGKKCSACKEMTVAQQVLPATGHVYSSGVDGTCNVCGIHRETTEDRTVMHMFRMYDPNSGEHFYTGSEEERDYLVSVGWNYEGVGFTFSMTTGMPVYRLYDPINGEHLYTMNAEEKAMLMAQGWNFEGIAFNSAYDTEVPQYRLHNPNETRGAYHFTASIEERDYLLSLGWEDQGIGFYSSWK